MTHPYTHIQQTKQAQLIQLAQEDTSSWTLLKEDKGVQLFTKRLTEKDTLDCCRGITTLQCSLEKAVHFLWNESRKYSLGVKEQRFIEEYSTTARVVYQAIQSPAFVSNRDFVYLSTLHQLNDQVRVITSVSVEHDKMPEQTGVYVRGELLLSGFYLKRLTDTTCQLQYFVHVNINGWIPAWLINYNNGSVIDRMAVMMEMATK